MLAENADLLVVSDLHLSEGFQPSEGRWSRNEDFFYDAAFQDFLRFHDRQRAPGRTWELVVIGDLFDFLQVTAKPPQGPEALERKIERTRARMAAAQGPESPRPADRETRAARLQAWLEQIREARQARLQDPGYPLMRRCEEQISSLALDHGQLPLSAVETLALEAWILADRPGFSLTKREREYGLGTTWQETAWKLDRIAEGHRGLFTALAWFIARGNSVVIVKGNHDVELYWPEVQTRLQDLLMDAYLALDPAQFTHPDDSDEAGPRPEVLRKRIRFLPWIYYVPELIYLEHGNQYEVANAFPDFLAPVLDNRRLIRLPPGSFFVRYYFNKIEEAFPFADNLSPRTRFLSWALANDFLRTFRLIFRYFGNFVNFLVLVLSRGGKNALQDLQKGDQPAIQASQVFPGQEMMLADVDLRELHNNAVAMQREFSARTRSFLAILPIAIIVLVPILLFTLPLLWRGAGTIFQNYWSRLAATAVLGFVAKQVLAPALLRLTTGGDYLEQAGRRVWRTLEKAADEGRSRPVQYIVFGHNHDADLRRIDGENSPWYVNTGCWVRSFDELDAWIHLEKDLTFLRVERERQHPIPGLFRWNPSERRPERLRLYSEVASG